MRDFRAIFGAMTLQGMALLVEWSGLARHRCAWCARAVVPLLMVALAGCAGNLRKQVLIKSTVFGFQVSASPSAGYFPSVQIGLVRQEYWTNPTNTQPTYCAPFRSQVQADLAPMKQTATETFSAAPPPATGASPPRP